jgi:hypothetical protein
VFDIPISDASFTEVLARVSYQLIHQGDYLVKSGELTPSEVMMRVANELEEAGFQALRSFVLSYAVRVTPIYSSRDVREQLILDARRGYAWRRVVYPPYKSGRRDPRVTNRGVTRRASIERE